MSFQVSQSLQFICKEISKQCVNRSVNKRFELAEMLKALNAPESYLVGKYFCELTWNAGSLGVLLLLQQQQVLSATQFVLSQQQNEQLQLILNDFLEADYELITNLFITVSCDTSKSLALSIILEETLRNLFKDLLVNPTINNLDYLCTLKATLPIVILKKVIHRHVNIILELHNCHIRDAFRNFTSWINEGVNDILFIKLLCHKLIGNNELDTFNYLFKLSANKHFMEWKFYLILLQTLASHANAETTTSIKKFIKTRLKQIAAEPCKISLLHLLLSARAILVTTMDIKQNLDAYADWYKQTIGEMKYMLDTEQFQNILKLLDECINYEAEEQYLEIHALILISPPVLCGKLVYAYKNKCKDHLSNLKSSNKKPPITTHPDESIIIEDSD